MARMSDEQIQGFANDVANRLGPSIASHLKNATRCCPNCEHFQGGMIEKCGLNNLRPPATVIAFGCECFVDNEIPF